MSSEVLGHVHLTVHVLTDLRLCVREAGKTAFDRSVHE